MSFVIQDIKLEQNVYAPGDVINGMVLLRADQPMNLSGKLNTVGNYHMLVVIGI